MVTGTKRHGITNLTAQIKSANPVSLRNLKTDYKYLDPRTVKPNSMGFLNNTWVLLYLDPEESVVENEDDKEANNKIAAFLTETQKTLLNDYSEVRRNLKTDLGISGTSVGKSVLLENISINISRTPSINEVFVSGSDTSIKQWFSNNSYDIAISGLFSGPYFWHQDSKAIRKFLEILISGKTIHIANPELQIIYDVNDIAVFNYNLNQL